MRCRARSIAPLAAFSASSCRAACQRSKLGRADEAVEAPGSTEVALAIGAGDAGPRHRPRERDFRAALGLRARRRLLSSASRMRESPRIEVGP